MNKIERQNNWTNYWKNNSVDSCRDGIKAKASELENFWAETAAMINDNDQVLDLCTGKGDVIQQLISYQLGEDKALAHYTGVDLSDMDSRVIEKKFGSYKDNIRFKYGTHISELPFEEKTFEFVTSQFGIEYAFNESVIKEICRVMKSKGIARFATHHKESALIKVAKLEIQHIDLLSEKGGFFDCMKRLIPVFAKLRNPANAKKINKDQNAVSAREHFNAESQKILTQAEKSSVPDLLNESLSFSRQVFDIAKIKGASAAKEKLISYHNELNLSKERMIDLIDSSLDKVDLEKLDKSFVTYGKKITKKEELKNDGEIVAWGIEIS